MLDIKGSIVALVTPMNEDGSVNYNKLEELLEYQIKNSTDAILIIGTTGESPTLSHEEDEEVVSFTVKKVNHRVPVIVGSSSNCTETTVTQSKKFERLGADALLIITPYYNKTNEEGMIHHFETVANSVNIPIIIYNVPGRTGCSVSVSAIAKLSKHPNIMGIKEASGNISYVMKIAKYANDNFRIYSGNDDMIVPVLSAGGVGVISVLANICPKETHDLVMNYLNGKVKESLDIQLKYLDVINNLFIETNPIPVKEAMNYLGMNVGGYRLPLYKMSDKNREILINSMKEAGLCK